MIDILLGGTTMMPRQSDMAKIAGALGDEHIAAYCEQSRLTDVVRGRRHCG